MFHELPNGNIALMRVILRYKKDVPQRIQIFGRRQKLSIQRKYESGIINKK